MRRRRGGMSTFTVGMIALVVTLVGVYLGFTKSIPFRHHYEVKAAFKSANNLRKASPVRIAGVEVGKVTKIERGASGRQRRAGDDADPGQGPAAALRRARSRSARASSSRATSSSTSRPARRARRSPTATSSRSTRPHAGPARPGPDRAADRHARGPQDHAARVRRRPQGQGRQGLQRLDQVLEARLPRLGDRRPRRCSARRSTTSPATSTAAASWPARSTATASRSRT